MLLETQTVSRKTPGDGRLEVSAATAEKVSALGSGLRLRAAGKEAPGSVETLTCTCAKRGEGTHVHYFLESEVLRALEPHSDVKLELEEAGWVTVSPA